MIENKKWGTSEEITNNFFRINIEKGGYSSMHCHLKKYNLFYVETGFLDVEVELCFSREREGSKIVTYELAPGDKLTIDPEVYHRFRAKTDVIAYELYWELSDPSQKTDIVRRDEGGIA